MSVDWSHAREIFGRLYDLPPAERGPALEAACGGDDGLRREVESLLAANDAAGSFLEDGAGPLDPGAENEGLGLEGRNLGPYRLERLLGQGGTSLVYRACDERLGRAVAVKILRWELAIAPEARRRFLREAKATAALDHPNIVRVFDTGQASGRDFLVMEYLEGHTLAERLESGPMPLAEALDYGCPIASALCAAHRGGILHRDLKPHNVMLAGPPGGPVQVKVLDFGLAKRQEARPSDQEGQSEALQTRTGAVMGTAAYMSPEQVEGRPVGPQSDIFSFGAILYEAIGGRRAFGGESAGAAMAAVLRDRPAPLDSPAWPLIARCLEKDAGRRFQTAEELLSAIAGLRAGGRLRRRRVWRRWTKPLALGALAAAAAAIGIISLRERSPHPLRSLVQLTSDSGLSTEPVLSPDGHMVAYASDRNGDHLEIWIQPIEGSGAVRQLTHGVADQHEPAFSPAGTIICYRSEAEGGALWTVPAAGGAPRLLARGGRGARYSPDGKWIAYWTGTPGIGDPAAPGNASVFVIPASGGAPRKLAPDFSARSPVWAPDSRYILFAGAPAGDPASLDWWIVSLDGGEAERTGAVRAFGPSLTGFNSELVADPSQWSAEAGGVLYASTRGTLRNLWLLPFSPRRRKISGPLTRMSVSSANEDFPNLSRGKVVYASIESRWNTWSLKDGELRPVTNRNLHDLLHALSADGERMVGMDYSGLVAYDLHTGDSRRLAPQPDWAGLDPAGRQVLYAKHVTLQKGQQLTVYQVPFEGGQPVKRATGDFVEKIWDITPDAATLLGMTAATPRGIEAVHLRTGRRETFLSHAGWNLYWATFSPDGAWVAFTARIGPEQSAVFVAPFHDGRPVLEGEWAAVTDGRSNDTAPHWSTDGKRLYYFSDRDGFRCIWSAEFHHGHPLPARIVRHFHGSRLSLGGVPVMNLQLGVARDRLVFSLCEPAGNIYLAK